MESGLSLKHTQAKIQAIGSSNEQSNKTNYPQFTLLSPNSLNQTLVHNNAIGA